MRSFSFKILYLGVFAPSVLYILTLPYLEASIAHALKGAIRQALIREDFDLLQGKVSLYDEVNRNVTEALARSRAIALGATVRVRISDESGNIIYPYYDRLFFDEQEEPSRLRTPGPLFDAKGYMKSRPAGDLEQFLQKYSDYIQGMEIVAMVNIPVTSWIGSGTLLAYILITVLILYLYYQKSTRLEEEKFQAMEARLESEKRSMVDQVTFELQEARERLAGIQAQEEQWLQEVERLEKEKEALEEELIETLEEREEQDEKIDRLKEEAVRKDVPTSRTVKEGKALLERFNRLYRNLEVDRKAVDDIVQLRDDRLKLQAEEVLKRLNDGDPSLKIRRKIAGVEKCEAFELGFGSSGRIYYMGSETRRFKVLRIGTKASQSKDLAYLQGRKK